MKSFGKKWNHSSWNFNDRRKERKCKIRHIWGYQINGWGKMVSVSYNSELGMITLWKQISKKAKAICPWRQRQSIVKFPPCNDTMSPASMPQQHFITHEILLVLVMQPKKFWFRQAKWVRGKLKLEGFLARYLGKSFL